MESVGYPSRQINVGGQSVVRKLGIGLQKRFAVEEKAACRRRNYEFSLGKCGPQIYEVIRA
jgi:hypothetical protein